MKNTMNKKATLDYKNRSSGIPDTDCKASIFIKFKQIKGLMIKIKKNSQTFCYITVKYWRWGKVGEEKEKSGQG